MTSKDDSATTLTTSQPQETGPWDAALDKLREWDPQWADLRRRLDGRFMFRLIL